MGKLALMGVAEIGIRLGVSRSRAAQIVKEKGFPETAATLIMGQVWEASDVEAWIAKRRPHQTPPR